jgi:3-methyladenine DNA glycosylase AlkC
MRRPLVGAPDPAGGRPGGASEARAMAEPFKNLVHPALVAQAGARLQRAWPAFDAGRFVQQACEGLEALELKARAMQVADALEATLPPRFEDAAAVIEAALAPPFEGDDASTMATGDDGLAGWILWPVGEYVARRGLDEPERALQVLHALTQRFSAEFAIRPFIVRHPARVFETLQRWTRDPSAHVRRLVSEGSRPRLPWGLRLQALVADPSPTLPLLEALLDDPSACVRRSVANHLNDIAKDHPALVVDWVRRHLPGASAERRALLKHSSRTLIKQGHAGMLQVWGLARPLRGEATLALTPQRLSIGEALTITLSLRSSAARTQRLVIDYAVHHVKADGRLTPKLFKGWVLELAAHETRVLTKRHSMRAVTTRRYHPGRHAVDLRINGRVVAQAAFVLE